MTSITRFPRRSPSEEYLNIGYNYFGHDFRRNICRGYLKRGYDEHVKHDMWEAVWYRLHLSVMGVKKPERLYSPRMRFFHSLVERIPRVDMSK